MSYDLKLLFLHEINKDFKIIKTDTIDITPPFKSWFAIEDYYVINPDSIIIAINPSGNQFYTHDSSLFLINRKGVCIGIANFNDAPVITWSKVPQYTVSFRPLLQSYPNYNHYNYFSPLVYDHNRHAVVSLLKCMNAISMTYSNTHPNYYASGMLYFNKPFRPFKEIRFESDSSLHYGMNNERAKAAYNNHTGDIVYGFGHNNILTIIDTNYNIREKNIGSHILDTIYPFKEFYDEFVDYNQGEFLTLTYDPVKNGYYRLIRVGNNRFGNRVGLKGKPYEGREVYVYQFIDSSFNLVAEGLAPAMSKFIVPFNDKLILYNEAESLKKGKIVYDVCAVSYKTITKTEYESQVRRLIETYSVSPEKAYSNYITEITKETKDKDYLVFNAEKSCYTCVEHMMKLLKEQKGNINSDKLSVILVCTNKENILKKLGASTLPPGIYIDDKGIYKNYVGDVTHLDWVEIKDNTPTITKYEPQEIGDLGTKLSAYLK